MPLRQDLRHSVRLLINEPRFSLVAILTLALAIGATTTLFSVIDAALLRAVPYPHPEQLVRVLGDESTTGEPMIAIYGEFGIRLEDCLYMTADGPRWFTQPSLAIDRPFAD